MEEYSTVPVEFTDRDNWICHGFHDWQLIHDHPLRGDIFNLKVHRRRWKHKLTQEVRSRDWKLVAKGTSFSQEFSDFLKELHRHEPRKYLALSDKLPSLWRSFRETIQTSSL